MSAQQLELFSSEPFCLRLRIEEAFRLFWENYWYRLPSAPASRAHRKRILKFFHGRFIDTISKHDVENLRNWLKESRYSVSTINKSHMLLSRMFTKLGEYKESGIVNGVDFSKIELPARNPCTLVPRVSERNCARRQIVTKAQFDSLMFRSDDDLNEELIMFLYTGLRGCDIRRLTEDNIDFTRGVLFGIQNKTITTRNPSGVPYRIRFRDRIKDILLNRLSRVKPGARLFPLVNWQKRWDKLRRDCNLTHIQIRDLRRTAATHMLDNGTDAQTVAEFLGHTSLRLLPTYTPRTLAHQDRAIERLEGSFE